MPRPKRSTPAELTPGWPNTPSPDIAAETIRQLALNLTQAMNGQSIRTTAGQAGVDHSSLADLIAGRTWPDSRLIALLEHSLRTAIWPGPQPS